MIAHFTITEELFISFYNTWFLVRGRKSKNGVTNYNTCVYLYLYIYSSISI